MRGLRRVALFAAGLSTFGFFGIALCVHWFGRRDRARAAGALVVLGALVHDDGTPSEALAARVKHAVSLYQRGLAPMVLFSGGPTSRAPAEARVAQALAVAWGVPASACLVEAESRSTEQNAALSAGLLKARGIQDAVLVTDGYHLLRARQWFRLHGLELAPSPAPLDERALSWTEQLFWTLREALALLARPRVLFARAPQMLASATR